ncbi:hypothetical protein VNO77_39344 [Canavalia gladiata]|uniref:Disease resistance RPP13-like protein 1 n=1 Tax=Canavalia gladiata TaxID=3824 RepID=A0AAN9PXN8_CANGL
MLTNHKIKSSFRKIGVSIHFGLSALCHLHNLLSFLLHFMAAELVGGALLSAFLQGAFQRLASHEVVNYFRRRKFNETLLKRLNIMLLSINAVLDDAEQKQIQNSHVKAWLDEVKDAVFEAEDLLDEIDIQLSKSELEAESESQTCTCKVLNFFNASFSSYNKEIESRMKHVLENLEYLESKKDILGLEEANSFGIGSGSKVLQKTSLVNDTVIYGRDDDKEIIFNWLMSENVNENGNQLSIISIVGMGGLGKTTLAQHLYNDPRMEDKFDIKAWVSVLDEFDVFKVARTILEAITKSIDDSRDLEMLHGRLKEILTEKRFLLVLDDVWNENRDQWEALQTPLNYGAQGSKIIVTTRSKRVASTMRANKVHCLEQLQRDHCWKLFARHAFGDVNPQLTLDFKLTGTKIVEKCNGLPLALKTVGCLLYTKSSILEWKSILTSEMWDLPEEDSNIIPALMLSYHHLPSHLKRCFAYCSLFPKDYMFDKEHLIQLWMAENFLQCPQQSKSMEEVGEQYFDDLLSRSFFQQLSGDEIYFVMHDLLNDLAKYVCGNICFRLEVEEAHSISKMTRHFSFSLATNYHKYFEGFESLYDAIRLRTFLPVNRTSNGISSWHCKMSSTLLEVLFTKFKFLRVLSLSGYSQLIEVPDSVGNLKHLRSLDLSGTRIKKLPDSTCLLYNLQILKLRYCRSLEDLPLNLHKLANLRCLDFVETKVRKMPIHLGKMKNLQVLSSFYVGKGSEFNIQQLEELNLHGKLSISELQNIVNSFDALAANLKNKIHLGKLELEWSENHNESQQESEVLEKLQPSQHLKELSVKNYGGIGFPGWFGDNSLSNMVSLNLSNCQNCVMLPPLGLLSSLKTLSIKGLHRIEVIGSEFYGSSSSSISFASLEALFFDDMKGWEEWDCNTMMDAFPRLRELWIMNCPKLKDHLPEQLPYLLSLRIYNCQHLVASIPRVPVIYQLHLQECGKLQFNYHPSTLEILWIGGQCMEGSLLERIGHTIYDTSLKILRIYDCPKMNVPMRHHCYNFLAGLRITSSCDSLKTFSLDFFPKLLSLELRECSNLEMISQEYDHNLMYLTIWECPKFVSFPKGGFSTPRLKSFRIEKLESLKSLPQCMHILLPSLHQLWITDCPQLESFSDGGFPSNLKTLYLEKCSKLVASLKWSQGTNCSLDRLYIGEVDVESFPDERLLPVSLTYVLIHNCPYLKKLDYKGLCTLSSLTTLCLHNCSRLQCLPEEGLPRSILTLQITGNCSSLKQRCQKPKGQDWGKIAHIKRVRIDDDIMT